MSSSPFKRIVGPDCEPVPHPELWVIPPQGLTVFHGETNLPRISHYFLPRLLLAGNPVLYVDGANRFDPLLLARFARSRGLEPAVFNEQLKVARAFTCFQLTELIERLPRLLQQFPARAVFITAMPDLYFDEDVREPEATASFQRALAALQLHAKQRLALAVFTNAGNHKTPRRKYFSQLTKRANHVKELMVVDGGTLTFNVDAQNPLIK